MTGKDLKFGLVFFGVWLVVIAGIYLFASKYEVPAPVVEQVTENVTKPEETIKTPDPVARMYTLQELMKRGEDIYKQSCSACHNHEGTGIPGVFPAIRGSKIVMGDRSAHINIVMHGKPGTAMAGFNSQLSKFDIAAVVTYERNAFGNNTGDTVQPDEIH